MTDTTPDTKNPTTTTVCAICGATDCPTGYHDSSTTTGYHDSSMPTSVPEGEATGQN